MLNILSIEYNLVEYEDGTIYYPEQLIIRVKTSGNQVIKLPIDYYRLQQTNIDLYNKVNEAIREQISRMRKLK